jgi:hypothetical protein
MIVCDVMCCAVLCCAVLCCAVLFWVILLDGRVGRYSYCDCSRRLSEYDIDMHLLTDEGGAGDILRLLFFGLLWSLGE